MEGAKEIIDNVGKSVSAVSGALKGKEGFIQGMASLVKAVTSLIGLLNDKKID